MQPAPPRFKIATPWRLMRFTCFVAAGLALGYSDAFAWGNEGHEVVALLAEHYLSPQAQQALADMLRLDTDNDLTAHDIASEATWADALRERNSGGAGDQTKQWHFVDIELADGNEDKACFGHPLIPTGTPAFPGVEDDCVVDKVDEFRSELASPTTPIAERLVALKFLLHFVGDMHQPLHAADDDDRGGNAKAIEVRGSRSRNLHAFWDTDAVASLGPDAAAISQKLEGRISADQVKTWQQGTPRDWAMEAFAIAMTDAYGKLPQPDGNGRYVLPADYSEMASRDAALQLSRAGVRLALVLNQALATPHP